MKSTSNQMKKQLFTNLHNAILENATIEEAIQFIVTEKTVSISFLQRKLNLGFVRTAAIVDKLEKIGIIGEANGAKPREIIITSDEWEEYLNTYSKTSKHIEQTQKESKKDLTNEQIELMSATDDLKTNSEIYKNQLLQTGKYIVNYYSINSITVSLVNIHLNLDCGEVTFEIKLFNARTSMIKASTRELALHLGVKYVEYVFPTSTKGTVGLKMPIPFYIIDDINYIQNHIKEKQAPN